MNAAVPRAKGGPIGPEPQIGFGGSPLHFIGQGAVHKVYEQAVKTIERLKPKSPAGGYTGPAEGPAGTSMYKGVLMATWVRQALEYGARHGSGDPQPTSGYRSHAQNVSEGRNYYSEHVAGAEPHGLRELLDPARQRPDDQGVRR